MTKESKYAGRVAKLKTLSKVSDSEVAALEKDLRKFEEDFRQAYTGKITKELTRPEQLPLAGFPTDLCRSTILKSRAIVKFEWIRKLTRSKSHSNRTPWLQQV